MWILSHDTLCHFSRSFVIWKFYHFILENEKKNMKIAEFHSRQILFRLHIKKNAINNTAKQVKSKWFLCVILIRFEIIKFIVFWLTHKNMISFCIWLKFSIFFTDLFEYRVFSDGKGDLVARGRLFRLTFRTKFNNWWISNAQKTI